MQYGGFDVYKIYLAVKLHFTTDYDYHKYEGRVNANLESFTKRNDRYFFHKLSTRYDKNSVLDYFVSNFLVDSKRWIGNLSNNEGIENYTKYLKYQDAFEYHFKSDCNVLVDEFSRRGISFDDGFLADKGQHPRVLRLLLQKRIHFQTALILDSVLSFSKNWDKTIDEKVIWPELSKKFKKFKNFIRFNQTSARLIMKEVFVNAK